MKVTVVIPVFNEEKTVVELVARVQASPVEKDIVIVDDGSTDGTPTRLDEIQKRSQNVLVIRHEENRGKGAALRTAFSAAAGDVVLIQDGDLEYDPAEYPRLLAPIEAGVADVVFGSRFTGGQSHRVLYYWHMVVNKLLTTLSNACTNLNMTDMTTCFKVFRRSVVAEIKIEEDGFGVEPELTAKVARLRCRVYEVGISYHGRTYEEGKKIRWRDGAGMVWCIIKYNWRA